MEYRDTSDTLWGTIVELKMPLLYFNEILPKYGNMLVTELENRGIYSKNDIAEKYESKKYEL